MKKNYISIINARENNLKSISLKIPKEKLVVITGVSGSGKSSLAFNVLYNEGRRRYVNSLSNYVKEFLGGTSKPDVDSIEGLSPTIAIDQKTTSSNPRSTVGTITEIYDFYRLLFGRIGAPYCPTHNIKISKQTITQITDSIYKNFEIGENLRIMSPVVKEKKGTHVDLLQNLKDKGYLRVKINDKIHKLEENIKLKKNLKHSISIVVDSINLQLDERSRIFEALTHAAEYSEGVILVEEISKEKTKLYSKNFSCIHGDFEMPNIEPRLFSFNSHIGSCSKCNGIGENMQVSWEKLVDENLSILEGGIKFFNMNNKGSYEWQIFYEVLNFYKIPTNVPVKSLSNEQREIILRGTKDLISVKIVMNNGNIYNWENNFEGVASLIERRYVETKSKMARKYYQKFLSNEKCEYCEGKRLNKYALAVKIEGINIYDLCCKSISDSLKFFSNLKSSISERDKKITKLILDEIVSRLKFLANVGLDYLSIERKSGTLSGGESQRIRLASQMGSKFSWYLIKIFIYFWKYSFY